jgi:hypothetical protein
MRRETSHSPKRLVSIGYLTCDLRLAIARNPVFVPIIVLIIIPTTIETKIATTI